MFLRSAASATVLVALAASAVSADQLSECLLYGACCFPKTFTKNEQPCIVRQSGTLGMPVVVGGLDKDVVRRYLKQRVGALAACAPDTEGTLEIAILDTGKAHLLRTEQFDAKATKCMAGVIAARKFPSAVVVTTVRVTLTSRTVNEPMPFNGWPP
ncbi:MAG TPA: hypothetical protein VGM90_05795 [Kofleriaceae bacterium]|jgi:hypothetical protein